MLAESFLRRSYLYFHTAPVGVPTPEQPRVACTCVIERASRVESLAELVYTIGLTSEGAPQVAWGLASEETCEAVRKKVDHLLFNSPSVLDSPSVFTPNDSPHAGLASEDPQERLFRAALFAANRMLQNMFIEHHPELAIDPFEDADSMDKYAALYDLSEKDSRPAHTTARFADWTETPPAGT